MQKLGLGTKPPKTLWEPINIPVDKFKGVQSKKKRLLHGAELEQATTTPPQENAEIVVYFCGADKHYLKMRMRMNMPFAKAMDLYCKTMNVTKRLMRFLYRDRVVPLDATPADLSMSLAGEFCVAAAWNWLVLNFQWPKGRMRKMRVFINAPLGGVLHAVCNSLQVHLEIFRFMYGNECILPHETPSSLGMKDGDVIDFAGSNTVNVLIYYGSPLQRRTFLVKKTDTLTNVLHVFCMHLRTHPNLLHFWFRGVRIRESDTPGSLGMRFNNFIMATSTAALAA